VFAVILVLVFLLGLRGSTTLWNAFWELDRGLPPAKLGFELKLVLELRGLELRGLELRGFVFIVLRLSELGLGGELTGKLNRPPKIACAMLGRAARMAGLLIRAELLIASGLERRLVAWGFAESGYAVVGKED